MFRRAAHLLAIVALIVFSALPAGIMLAPASAGGDHVQVVICTGHGPATIALDADGKPMAPKPEASKSQICTFAGAAFATLDAPGLAVESLPAFAPYTPDIAFVGLSHQRFSRAVSARGPPTVQS